MSARVVVKDTRALTWEQLDEHRKIGGSDAPVVAGVSRWEGPVALWLRKTKQIPPVDETENMLWGSLLEPVILGEFGRRNDLKVTRRHQLLAHPDHDHATVLLDGQALHDGRWIPVEIKTAAAWDDGWTDDEIPVDYTVQVQHELAVTGAPYAFVAVLLGGRRYRDYRVERDDQLIADLLAAEHEFWGYVERREMPPAIDGRASTTEALNHLHGRLGAVPVDLPVEAIGLRNAYWREKTIADGATERADQYRNQLRALLLDAGGDVGFVDGEKVATWRRPVPKTPRFDEAAFAARFPGTHRRFSAVPAPDSLAPRLTVAKPKRANEVAA